MKSFRLFRACVLLGLTVGLSGCQWWQSQMDAMQGEGFQDWNNSIGGSNLRGKADAKDSGYFLGSKKAAQIEKNLGGDYD